MTAKSWFLDSNVVAHWAMSRGGILDAMAKHQKLATPIVEAFHTAHKAPAELVQRAIEAPDKHEWYTSELVLTEIWKAIKDEAIAVLHFQKGTPLSRWPRNPPSLTEALAEALYNAGLEAIDQLLADGNIVTLQDALPSKEGFWGSYVPALLVPDRMHVMDSIIVATAHFNQIDVLVTSDGPLLDAVNKELKNRLNLKAMKPAAALKDAFGRT